MADTADSTNVRTTESPEADQAHVVCQVMRTRALKQEGVLELRWSLRGSFFPAYTIKVDALETAIDKTRMAINQIVSLIQYYPDAIRDSARPAAPNEPPLNRLFAELASGGYEIHNVLLPTKKGTQAETVAKWLKGLVRENRIGSVEIQIEDRCDVNQDGPMPAVPWNLVYDEYVDVEEIAEAFTDEASATWARFWGIRFDLSCGQNVNPLKSDHRIDPKTARAVIVMDQVIGGRLLEDEDRKSAFDVLIARINALGEAQAEADGAKRGKTPVVSILHDVNELKRYVRKNGLPNLLYWLSHARPDALYLEFAADAAGNRKDSQEVKLYDLEQILSIEPQENDDPDAPPAPQRRLIAFLNGCQTSEASEQGSFLRSFTGFEQVSGLITTEQETLDVFAHHFGMKFLNAFFLEQKPVGQILRDLRRESLPLGLLYGTYCPPTIRLAKPRAKAAAEPIPVAISDYLGESLRKLSATALAPGPPVKIAPNRPRTKLKWPDKPYPSLGFYTLADQALFLGREEDSARLAEMVDSPDLRVLLLHGTSGSGKSSVIRAGLVPYLEKYAVGYRFRRRPETKGVGDTEHLHLFFRPSDNFAARLAADLLAFTAERYELPPLPDGTQQEPVNLRPILAGCVDPQIADISQVELRTALDDPKRPELLCEILDALTAAIPEKLVITIDQAEELYTLAQDDTPEEIQSAEKRRRQAFAQLRECLRGSGRWKIILSYRTEYHGRITDGIRAGLKKTPGLADYLITDLNKAQLRQVIERPTLDFPVVDGLKAPREIYRFGYEPGVIDEIVDGIFRLRGRNTDSVLPIAQVVCTRLYENALANAGGKSLAVVSKRELDRLRHSRRFGLRAGDDLVGGADSADFDKLPAFYRNWVLRAQEKLESAQGKSADGDGPVLEILEDFATATLRAVSEQDPAAENSLRQMMMRLYLTQPDGTVTSAQMDRKQARERFWHGSAASFDKALTEASAARLLREEAATGSDETEEATIRLGHDTLCKVAGRWDAAEQARRRVRKLQITVMAATALCAVMVLLAMSADRAKKRAEVAEQNALDSAAVALENQEKAEAEKKKADEAKKDALKQMQVANAFAADATLMLATNLFDVGNDERSRNRLATIPTSQRHFPWGLLNRQIHARNPLLVKGHTNLVFSVAFSPDGKTLASGAFDNTIRLWDLATGDPKGSPLEGHNDRVTSVAFSPDGKTLASGAFDNTIRLWDLATGDPKGSPLVGHTKEVLSVAFSPDGKTLASGSWDNKIRLWDVATGAARGTPLAGHTNAVISVAFSPDGKTLASGSGDNTIRLWDLATGDPKGSPLSGHTGEVFSVSFSRDGQTLVSGSSDKTILLWVVATGTAKGPPLAGHKNTVTSVAFSPDGQTLASSSADRTIRIWDLATSTSKRSPLTGHTGEVTSVAFSPDGKTLASGANDEAIRLWDLATDVLKGSILAKDSDVFRSVAFSPDGQTLAFGSNDNSIRLWDVASGEAKGMPLNGHKDEVSSLAFSPDGKLLASGGSFFDDRILLWDVETGLPRRTLQAGRTGFMNSMAFSPDGKILAWGSADEKIRFCDVATGELKGEPLIGHSATVLSVAFSPDGKTLASGSWDKTIRLWDVATGEPKGSPLEGHKEQVTSVSFSPDSETLASGSYDKTIRLWDVATGEPKGSPLEGHNNRVTSVAFSPDGKTLASGADDDTIRLWATVTGSELRKIAFEQPIRSLFFVPADKTGKSQSTRLVAAVGKEIYVFDCEINQADTTRIRDERIARNFLRFYPLHEEAIAAIRRNETLTPEEKDRIAGIIQPLIDFHRARAAANAIPLPDDVFQP